MAPTPKDHWRGSPPVCAFGELGKPQLAQVAAGDMARFMGHTADDLFGFSASIRRAGIH